MSERSYFSLRYAVPGYTFILFIVILNFDLIMLYLGCQNQINATIFASLISLISGSAIGFVISQAWWLIYQKFGPYCFWPCGELRKPFERLIEKYGLDDKLRERRTVMQVMYDYVIRSLPKDDPHLAYLVRRWDLWTLLWSEIFAVILGFAGGIVVFGVVSFVPIFFYFWFYNWIRILLTVLTPFVIICLLYGQKRILEETDVIAKAIINKTDVYYSLKRAFPEYFNDGNC